MIDPEKLLSAMQEVPVGDPISREIGAGLVDAWIEENYSKDSQLQVLAVEMGFQVWLDEQTVIVGVQDAMFSDGIAPFGGEWKSAKEPKRNKDGSDSAWWNEEKWLEEISNGPQLAIYALAEHEGTYFEKVPGREFASVHKFNVDNPRIMVRAAVKANPVRFWPSEGDGVYQFQNEAFESIKNALRVKAEQIRAAVGTGLVPWQLTGKQCFQYGRECQFALMCQGHNHPPVEAHQKVFSRSDPAFDLAVQHIPQSKLEDPGLVILSASSYGEVSNCMEKYRLVSLVGQEGDESQALDVGSVMHGGLAELYRQIREEQNNGVSTTEAA